MRVPLLRQPVVIEPGEGGFNGSIAPFGDGWILVDRAGGFLTGTPIVQRVRLLDAAFRPRTRPLEFSSGRELDPRILHDGKAFRIFSFYHRLAGEVDPDGRPRVRTLGFEKGEPVVGEPTLVTSPDFPLAEIDKNWVPFLHDGGIRFVHRAEPHDILALGEDGCVRLVHSTRHDFAWSWGPVSGGTPAVPIGRGEYLTLFHSFVSDDPSHYRTPRRYFVGAYTFRAEPPFDVLCATREPLAWDGLGETLPRAGPHDVVYPAGLVAVDGRLFVSYGENDSGSCVAEMRLDDLLACLE